MEAGEILLNALRLLTGGLASRRSAAASIASAVTSGRGRGPLGVGVNSGVEPLEAGLLRAIRKEGEATEYPKHMFTYDLDYEEGPPVHQGQADGDVEAGRMQTLAEHNHALQQFIRPGMTPKQLHQAVMMGEQAERDLPQFWEDKTARRPLKGRSSAVSGIRITPDNRIEVEWGTNPGQWYTYKQFVGADAPLKVSREAQKLINAPSIGQAVMPVLYKDKNGVTKKKKFKAAPAGGRAIGWFCKDNYDKAFA